MVGQNSSGCKNKYWCKYFVTLDYTALTTVDSVLPLLVSIPPVQSDVVLVIDTLFSDACLL